MENPETIILIHRTMVEEELQRKHPEHHRYFTEAHPTRGPIDTVRSLTGRFLIATGSWIEPSARSVDTSPSATGGSVK